MALTTTPPKVITRIIRVASKVDKSERSTMTPMAGDDAGAHEVVRGFHALKRMAEPSEIANAALFLLSDQASFVTGSAMIVDGGNSINKL